MSLALLAGGVSRAWAEAPIVGAFGAKLGDQFDPKQAIAKLPLPGGGLMYEFTPDKESTIFKKFYVLIAPRTNKIYSVWAVGQAGPSVKVKSDQAELLELLKKKYGESKKEGAFLYPLPDLIRYDQGSRSLIVKVHDRGGSYSLDITYLDAKLEKEAERERRDLERETEKEKSDAL